MLMMAGNAADRSWIGRILAWVSVGALLVAGLAAAGLFRATVTLPSRDIAPESGHAFIAPISHHAWLVTPGDDETASGIDAVALFENGIARGPGRQLHQAIRDKGTGRFAVNRGYVRFSASDNSDPRKNGRSYRLQLPVFAGPFVWLLAVLEFAVSVFLIVSRFRAAAELQSAPRRELVWRLAIPGIAIGAAAVFAALRSIGSIALTLGAPTVPLMIGVMVGGGLALTTAWPAVRRDLQAVSLPTGTLRLVLWAVLCAAIGVLAYAAVFASGLVTVHYQLDNTTFQAGQGKAFSARLPTLPSGLVYDDYTRTHLVSPTRLFVNGAEFGLRIDSYAAIAQRGGGRFTIAQNYLLFSTADASDPRTNGRRYDIITPVLPGSTLFFVSLLAASLCSVGLRWSRRIASDLIAVPEIPATGGLPVPVARTGGVAAAAVIGFLLAILVIVTLWNVTCNLSLLYPRPGIGMWLAPFIVVACVLRLVLTNSFFGYERSHAAVFVQTFLAVMVITLAGMTPLLDTFLNADSFSSVRPNGSDMLAMIHANDSASYLGTAMHIVVKGAMDGVGSNRPLNGTILAWAFWLGAGKLPIVLFYRAALIAFTVVVAARELAKSYGWLCGILFAVFVTSFTAEFLPTGLSEPNGVAFACLAIALFVRSLRLGSFGFFIAGVVMTTLASMARPGAMLLLPVLVLFAWSARAHFGIRSMSAIGGTLLGIVPGALAPVYLNMTLAAPPGWVLSNFPLVLYGLASGGKGWTQFAIDHPHVRRASEIYALALEKIWTDPSPFFGVLAREFAKFWPMTFEFTGVDLFFALSLLGALVALVTVRNVYSRLLVAIVAAVWLSSPFIIMDGGYRVFAATIPFWALLAIWPLATLQITSSTSHPLAVDHLPPNELPGLARWAGMSGWTSAVVCGLIVVTPLMFRRPPPEIMTRTVASTCASGEKSVLVRGARTAQITHIVSDKRPRSIVPFIRESALNRHLIVNAPDIPNEIGYIPSGSSLVQIIEPIPNSEGREEYNLVIFKEHEITFPANRIVEICVTSIAAEFNGPAFVSKADRWWEVP